MRILYMYMTMLPLILGGIVNMLFTKTKLYKNNNYPIDCYAILPDGKRMLGNNKTFIGFISMIIWVLLFQLLLGFVSSMLGFDSHNAWYRLHSNSIINNIKIGFMTGLVYMICELPNSFIKRRLGIQDGKTGKGIIGTIFYIIDQIDSLIGVFLVLLIWSNLTIAEYIEYIFIGALSHIIINKILFKFKIRQNKN